MRHGSIHKWFIGSLVLAAIAAMVPAAALAIGTTSGTAIGNTPTVQFSVGGQSQPLFTAPTATFVVDTKVIFTVAKNDGTPISVPPSSTARVLHFTLSNASNAAVRFLLTASNLASGSTVTFGATPYNDSNVDAGNLHAFYDANGNGSYDANEEYITVAAGAVAQTVNVLVAGDIPAATSGQIIGIVLTAQAVDGSGNPLVESASDTAGVDIVLADGAGTDDASRSGTYTDRHAYRISSAILSVVKTATTIWDPFNYDNSDASKAKAIPGALIRYAITITNDAAATDSAILTTVSDALNGNLAIDPDLKVAANNGPLASLANESGAGIGFKVTGSGVGNTRSIASTPKYFTTTSTADGIDHNNVNPGGIITATMATVLSGDAGYTDGELKKGESVTIEFNVIVQ